MMTRGIFAAILLVTTLAPPAAALETDELLALIAMPLVVDEVADMADVPQDRLGLALAALAGADLRPTQYVEVVQYTPVALTYDLRSGDTDFVQYVRDIRTDGLVGDPFYDAVTTYYVDTYGIPREVVRTEPVFLSDGRMLIVQDSLVSPGVPTVVTELRSAPTVTRTIITDADWSMPFATGSLELDDLVALMAMPLVVDQVADLVDVPETRLAAALAAFAGADLRPIRFVEVTQFLPVALAFDQRTGDTDFVRFVSDIRSDGLVGDPFYNAVTARFVDIYGIPRNVIGFEPLLLRDGSTIAFQDRLISPVVQTVVSDIRAAPAISRTVVADARWSAHPHGGPPGQLKKQLGLQTGAEVVHGTDGRRGRVVQRGRDQRVIIDRDEEGRVRGRRAEPRAKGQEGGRPARVDRAVTREKPRARADRPEKRDKPDRRARGQERRKPSEKAKRDQERKKPPTAAAKADNRGQQKAAGGQGKSGKQGKGNKKKDDGRKS